MNVDIKYSVDVSEHAGAETEIAAMDEYSRAEIGRKTYRFVQRCMQDPVLRERIKARAEELRALGVSG